MKTLLKCGICGKYTMKEECACKGKAITPKPAKFSMEDKYGRYRREFKSNEFKERGLL